MKYVILILILALSIFAMPAESLACSGGAPFLIGSLEDHDIIVHAKVLEVDERGYNAILQVNHYYKGYQGEFLAVVRYTPALENVATVRNYDTSCLYSGGGREWVAGTEGYFALMLTDNGVFTDGASTGYGKPHFFVQDGLIEFFSFDSRADVDIQRNEVSEDEFVAMLLEVGNRSQPVSPIANPYPLMKFLNITTESGLEYRLHPDRSLTPVDPLTDPLSVSPDGSHVVFRLNDGELGFQYLGLKPYSAEVRDGGWLIPKSGQAATFSPDSNFVVVEEAERLLLYMFHNYERGGYGQRMTLQVAGEVEIQRRLPDDFCLWYGVRTVQRLLTWIQKALSCGIYLKGAAQQLYNLIATDCLAYPRLGAMCIMTTMEPGNCLTLKPNKYMSMPYQHQMKET